MKKTLIALAVLGAAAGVAHAQSNVTIYGVLDTGFVKQTGRDLFMGTNQDSKIGFRGQEDLGGNLKATFELEKRLDLNDGTMGNTYSTGQYKGTVNSNSTNPDWDGAANIGLAGKDWGRVRFGRVNELSTETIRKFDPFYQYSVASMFWSSQRSARISNTVRYDSPKWSGFNLGASYTLGGNTKTGGGAVIASGVDNDGYAINLSYDNAGFLATANWSRVADSDSSSVWNIGLGYKFGPARVTLTYEDTKEKGYKGATLSNVTSASNGGVKGDQNNWLLGLEWDIGPGQLDASVQRNKYETAAINDTNWKYGVGYTYNLSKRTSVYGMVSYTDYDSKASGKWYTGMERESVTGFQLGMTHKF